MDFINNLMQKMSEFAAVNIEMLKTQSIWLNIISFILLVIAGLLHKFWVQSVDKDEYTNSRMLWESFKMVLYLVFAFMPQIFNLVNPQYFFIGFIISLVIVFVIDVVLNIEGFRICYAEFKITTIIGLLADLAFMGYAITELLVLTSGIL